MYRVHGEAKYWLDTHWDVPSDQEVMPLPIGGESRGPAYELRQLKKLRKRLKERYRNKK